MPSRYLGDAPLNAFTLVMHVEESRAYAAATLR